MKHHRRHRIQEFLTFLSREHAQAKPDKTGCCGTDKISEDGKRHHCDKPSGHTDDLHACLCGTQWKHMM